MIRIKQSFRFSLFALTSLVILLFLSEESFCQTFTRITNGEIVNDPIFSWGCTWGDYNDDGYIDLFAGNDGINALYLNNGDATFNKILTEPFATDAGNSRGGSWGDYDNDGYLDLFVPNRGSANFLYRNNGTDSSYTFEKIIGSVLNDETDARGSSWGDYDNDGFIDLIVARNGNNFLYNNNNDGTFTQIFVGPVVTDVGFSLGPIWCDFDNDGDIDLHVANMQSGGNFFYINDGNGSFIRDTTSPVGTDLGNFASGSWGDIDNDGDMDLFVANAPGTNFLYINSGPPDFTFTKIFTGPIATDGGTSYGSTWADFDNDGFLDLFVANENDENFYYHNDGPPDYSFTKDTTVNIVTDGGSSWGSCVGDINNDGSLDLFIANTKNNFLYLNDGNSNNWINIKCIGTTSNNAAIGTRVLIKAVIKGNSTWQVRDVVGQTTYYSQSAMNIHFGLGDATIIDSVLIQWPSGAVDSYRSINSNQFITATEGGILTGIKKDLNLNIPDGYSLEQNYPNPFNPSTIIRFSIPEESNVSIVVFNSLGEEVRTLVNENFTSGSYEVEFDASGFPSGIYLYKINAGSFVETKKMILLK